MNISVKQNIFQTLNFGSNYLPVIWQSLYVVRKFQDVCPQLLLHQHFLNDFVKFFETCFTDCMNSFASAREMWLTKQTNAWQDITRGTNKLL